MLQGLCQLHICRFQCHLQHRWRSWYDCGELWTASMFLGCSQWFTSLIHHCVLAGHSSSQVLLTKHLTRTWLHCSVISPQFLIYNAKFKNGMENQDFFVYIFVYGVCVWVCKSIRVGGTCISMCLWVCMRDLRFTLATFSSCLRWLPLLNPELAALVWPALPGRSPVFTF